MPRKRGETCSRKRCKRPVSVAGYCKTHATEEADRLFSLIVRSPGRCAITDETHAGNLQCAHVFSRLYRSVRWDFRNAYPLCAKHHTYYTHRPEEWDDWRKARLGPDLYGELRGLALDPMTKPDLELVISELRLAWAALEAA